LIKKIKIKKKGIINSCPKIKLDLLELRLRVLKEKRT